ncbi:MAG: Stk1 family PASTA domain-containing Ser/Thr kinase [Oscillospiraceae bacterium]|nr:Stk1 family PASTA domain-containing Ser/Thr kinase [Oscillospiraceae bacterium]
MDRYIGKKLDGRYEIQEIIGVGGMANVYKAYDVIDGRTVAVKILRDEHMQNEDIVRRFRNESKAISVLTHPNIVKVYDVSFNDKIQYIVMEFIDGITLKEYIDQQHVLRWKEAVHFTVQILRALQHAHDKGIVHRDIKPQNIMLLSDGTIKVADFGIARFARSSQQTLTDRAIGSVHYISPEQARGDVTDEKSDIYSIGVMLYEMTTGKLPFNAESPVTVALQQIQSQPKKPRELNPEIPEGLESITIRAMQKDPARRYQSAAEMLRDIEEFKRNPTVSFEYKYTAPEESTISEHYKKASEKVKKENEDPARHTPIVPVLTGFTVAFIIVSIIFVIGILYMVRPFEEVPDMTMPSLVGMDYKEAQKKYSGLLDIEVESSAFHEIYGKDVIYDQSVVSGMTIKEGARIRIKISSGVQLFTLADYKNVEENQVYAILSENNIEFTTIQEYNSTIQEGYVIRTEPGADTEVDSGTVVIIYVSLGAQVKYTEVPELSGYRLDDAKMLLSSAKLKVGTVTRVDSGEAGNVVLGQTPDAGTMMEEGQTVNLIVSMDDEESSSLQIMTTLPGDDRVVDLKATLDGTLVHEESLNPAQARYWKVAFDGEGEGRVTITYDGKVYREYLLDFDLRTVTLTADHASEFTKPVASDDELGIGSGTEGSDALPGGEEDSSGVVTIG